MSETIVISPTTRQEGHAELSMEVDEEGIVTTGRYFSITPVRGLEKMVVGKRPETAPILVQRICGVCPVTHTLASVEAIDDSLKIDIPKNAKYLREMWLNAHIIKSHAIHQFLIAPDYVPEDQRDDVIRNVSEIRKHSQFVEDIVGGEGIHPSDIRIGGMAHNITKNAKNKVKTRIQGMMNLLKEHVEMMATFIEEKELPKHLGEHKQPVFASSNTYGSNTAYSMQDIEEILPESWYDTEKIGKRACTQIPLYRGEVVETGPRARAEKFRKFKERGTKAQNLARAEEMITAANRILELVDQLDTSASVMAKFEIKGTDHMGVGFIEGPRGTNIHTAKVSPEGYISDYRAIVPTTWNIPTMGLATEGFHHDYAPDVIRGYDPCLSCATHMIVRDDETKEVLKNEMIQL